MGFKKTVKRISALGVGASMVGATIFGAMAADLAQYPSQYIQDGKFTGVLVVGDKAAAEDVIGVSDIVASLQFAATTPAGASGSTLSASGDAWQVQKGATNVMEMSENDGTINTGTDSEAIATITSSSFIDDAELPGLLASGTVSNSKGDSPYDQRMYFEYTDTGYVQYLEDRSDLTADFLYFPSGKQIARYELEFTTSLESDVDDSAGTQTSTGDYLTDMEDTQITMLGTEFTIVQARRNGGLIGQVALTLMGGAVRDTLNEGTTKTYTIDGTDYEVTLDYVDTDSAKFTINGEGTRDMLDGDTDKLSDGTVVGVSEILYQAYAGGVHNAEFFLGAQKLVLKDTNSNSSAYSNELKVDDETIDGATVDVQGSDDGSTFKIDKISINMTADDDYYVPAGGKLSENPELDEPDLIFTKGWDIEYQGLSDTGSEEISIKASGSDDYELSFLDGKGNQVKLPIANSVSGSIIRFGDTNDDLIVIENKSITKDDYFIVTDVSDTNGERQTFALRYRGADKISADNPVIKFVDLGSGDTLERTISAPSSQKDLGADQVGPDGLARYISEIAQIKLGGGVFRVYNTSTSASNDFKITVDLDADGTPAENVNPGINTKAGASILIQNGSNLVNVSVSTPNSDDFDDLTPRVVNWTLTGSAAEVRLAAAADSALTYTTPDDDDDNSYTYTTYGAFVQLYAPTNSPQEVIIDYPLSQRLPQVFITGEGTSFTSTAAASSGAVTVQRIDVGATKLASEVPDVNAVNSILVGGPCANAAAAAVMGTGADCAEGFTPGVGKVQMFDVGTGNVAMLVAGYAAADTRNAAAVVSNYQDYSLSGAEMEVKKVGSSLTVAEPSAVEEVAEEEEESSEEATE
ncbi:MAG: hypothetical protein QF535_10305 [Anaerolineales bacterium]|nr:hypothetical protein [Anaerolineales bacterium]